MAAGGRPHWPVRVVVVDNYDSFTHNIVHALEERGGACQVVLNDALPAAELMALRPDAFVISAGPCTPAQAGVSGSLVLALLAEERPTPLLGICLGHQTIASALGAKLVRARRPMHGECCRVKHDGQALFAPLPQPLTVARYNSLVIDEASLPNELEACGWAEDGDLMALRHRTRPIDGVQFHPESALSQASVSLFDTWLHRCAHLTGQANETT